LKTRYRIVKLRNGKYRVLHKVLGIWFTVRWSDYNGGAHPCEWDSVCRAEEHIDWLKDGDRSTDIIEVVKEL
jgi:hypothetical protein